MSNLQEQMPKEQKQQPNEEEQDSLPPFALHKIDNEVCPNVRTLKDDDEEHDYDHDYSRKVESLFYNHVSRSYLGGGRNPFNDKDNKNLFKYKYNEINIDQQQGNEESMSFSKLMNQADNRTSLSQQSPSTNIAYDSTSPSQEAAGKETVSATVALSLPSIHGKREIALNKMTQDSFQLSVQLRSPKVSVRDVVDVIANPDMLQFWCEPITDLVVTEHTRVGGSKNDLKNLDSYSRSDGSTLSLSTLSSTVPLPSSSFQMDTNEQFIYQSIDDCDDDVIVPPAHKKCIKMVRHMAKPPVQQREECGEWIKASTPEIILPRLHTTIFGSCFQRVSTFLGFPNYGSLSMFIERNKAQVKFELGPFHAGTMLSHDFKIKEVNGHYGSGVILVDEVTIIPKDDEDDDGWILGSWYDPLRDMTKQWYTASLDGYIIQTEACLRNLIDLVEEGGGGRGVTMNNRYGKKNFF